MSDEIEEPEVTKNEWVIRVTTMIQKNPTKYKNFFLGVQGDRKAAEHMKKVIYKRGFQVGGERFFADAIKNLTIRKDGEVLNDS